MEAVRDSLRYRTKWTIRKFNTPDEDAVRAFLAGKGGISPFEVNEVEGNLLLNEGITALLNLLTGAAEDSFTHANCYIGVGDSSTAASASQTGLQASSNKAYIHCEATYPQISNQTITWRSIFTTSDGNFSWQEFTVASGSSDAADNLNRKVDNQGTKVAGQTWTIDLAITFS